MIISSAIVLRELLPIAFCGGQSLRLNSSLAFRLPSCRGLGRRGSWLEKKFGFSGPFLHRTRPNFAIVGDVGDNLLGRAAISLANNAPSSVTASKIVLLDKRQKRRAGLIQRFAFDWLRISKRTVLNRHNERQRSVIAGGFFHGELFVSFATDNRQIRFHCGQDNRLCDGSKWKNEVFL